jgi:hypothetical protein
LEPESTTMHRSPGFTTATPSEAETKALVAALVPVPAAAPALSPRPPAPMPATMYASQYSESHHRPHPGSANLLQQGSQPTRGYEKFGKRHSDITDEWGGQDPVPHSVFLGSERRTGSIGMMSAAMPRGACRGVGGPDHGRYGGYDRRRWRRVR